jgi:hypothetical protein
MMRMRPTTPPTTPPAIAPVLLDDLEELADGLEVPIVDDVEEAVDEALELAEEEEAIDEALELAEEEGLLLVTWPFTMNCPCPAAQHFVFSLPQQKLPS